MLNLPWEKSHRRDKYNTPFKGMYLCVDIFKSHNYVLVLSIQVPKVRSQGLRKGKKLWNSFILSGDFARNLRRELKVKVKLSLCFFLNWAPRHEGVLGQWKYSSTHSLTSALDGGEWSASRFGRFTPRERALGTHWIRGWVCPRAVLDAVVKRKIPSPPPRIEP
jgi:hypothetical protein